MALHEQTDKWGPREHKKIKPSLLKSPSLLNSAQKNDLLLFFRKANRRVVARSDLMTGISAYGTSSVLPRN